MRSIKLLWVLLAILAASPLRAAETVWPGAQWERVTPQAVGMDEALLAQARDYALTGGGSGYITRHGKLVLSWGDPRARYDLKSSTKSFGSIALGLALKDGKIALEEKAKKHHSGFGAPCDKKAPLESRTQRPTGEQALWLDEITIAHLASQTAGFEKPGGSNKVQFKPGTYWLYSDSGPNWLAECITLATRRDVDELMFERVFTPLGIGRDDLVWRKNSYRPPTIEGIARREFGAGISANVDALARIGYLMLNEGRWNGREILDREYARQSPRTPPGHETLRTFEGDPHGNAASHYGLLWWNNNDGTLKNVPRDAFWSWGLYDSFIFVVPSLDIVVARAGKSWKRKDGVDDYEVLDPFFGAIARSVRAAQQFPSSSQFQSQSSSLSASKPDTAVATTGPLRVHPKNTNYFTDGSGKAIYLTGSHSWGNFQEYHGGGNPPPPFDYERYLDFLSRHHHNFMRLWVWESPRADGPQDSIDTYLAEPMPYARTGPGLARDGKPKFDLTKFDRAYFERLRERVIAARERGIYVSVMLFQGWSVRNFSFIRGRKVFMYHPYHKDNNVNSVSGDVNGNGEGEELNTLDHSDLIRLQEAYLRKVVDTVNDLDNVLYEVSNESYLPKQSKGYPPSSKDWQYHVIRFVQQYEKGKPKQHPVGISGHSKSDNEAMLVSPADWVALGCLNFTNAKSDPWRDNPPAADGRKVNILDTDHLGAESYKADAAYSRAWVWKSFTRGHNPILMEWMDLLTDQSPGFESARRAMGHTRTFAMRINLAHMLPREALTSTDYCLADPGAQYLVYQSVAGPFTVKLVPGHYQFEWFNPASGKVAGKGKITAGPDPTPFTPPFAGDAVLYIFCLKK